MNNVTLIGNVCRDFELRQTNTGTSVASNTIAVKRNRKEADGTYASDFFDIYCFGAQADYAVKYIRKGDRVGVTGDIHVRDYTMKNGTKGRAVEVNVTTIESLTSKDEAEKQPSKADRLAPPVEETTNEAIDVTDDDLPF